MITRLIIVVIASLMITFFPYFLGYAIETYIFHVKSNAIYFYIAGIVYCIVLGILLLLLKRAYNYIKYGI